MALRNNVSSSFLSQESPASILKQIHSFAATLFEILNPKFQWTSANNRYISYMYNMYKYIYMSCFQARKVNIINFPNIKPSSPRPYAWAGRHGKDSPSGGRRGAILTASWPVRRVSVLKARGKQRIFVGGVGGVGGVVVVDDDDDDDDDDD